jgi:quinoprotein dehydrogenase-associated probable ABC transporter substrate-binding protein
MRCLGVFGALLLLVDCFPESALAQAPSLVATDQLRVCAEPHNLPLSDDKEAGIENKLVQLPVHYTWFPQVVGFERNTLAKDRCDLASGSVSGEEGLEDTNPYYHSAYMLVSRADAGITAHKVGDPALANLKFGVIAGTPPSGILVQDDLMDRTKTYALVVDTRLESPAHDMLQDLVAKNIDVGLLWGPFAGYLIKHDSLPLKAVFLEPEGPVRLDFRITMAVRPGEADWRRRINAALLHHQDDIRHILDDFGIPLLDDQNKPLNPTPNVE